MALNINYQSERVGNKIRFIHDNFTKHRLPPDQGLQLTFPAKNGRITITVKDEQIMQLGTLASIRGVGGIGGIGGGGIGGDDGTNPFPIDTTPLPDRVTHVPLDIELIAPGQAEPIETWLTTDYDDVLPGFTIYTHDVGSQTNSIEGDWTCRVTNNTIDKVANASLRVRFFFEETDLKTRNVPMRLLNHVFSVALDALMPRAKLRQDKAIITFNAELKSFFKGDSNSSLLDNQVINLPNGVNATGQTLNVHVGLASGADLLREMEARYQQERSNSTSELEQWRANWISKVSDNDPVIHAKVLATDIVVDYTDIPFFSDINLATIENVSINVFIAFPPGLNNPADILVTTPAEFTAGLINTGILGVFFNARDIIEQALSLPIKRASLLIGRYLGEFLVNIITRGNAFFDVAVSGNQWRVRYYTKPGDTDNTSNDPPVSAPVDTSQFDLGDDSNLDQLDKINTIVVLMQENRSFDHMLGYLKAVSGDKYEGFTPATVFTNPSAPNLTNLVAQSRASLITRPGTQIFVDPHHDFDSVASQIADGAMSGFASNFADRGDQYIPMSYYTDIELPVFYQLANSFNVCDHWFAAHPGPTWPNRFATMMGSIPQTNNFEITDSQIGWYKGFTIFDLLRKYNIEWRYFEGDISFARLFDNYRLDDEYIIPFEDENDGFERYLNSGSTTEPRVIFIDPNFVDLPPIISANDDHPPANLKAGQELVKNIYNILVSSERWSNTMFIITYDEHGGFFDHVVPPGIPAPLGPSQWIGKIPLLNPDGANHLGVRVPSLVISPWVGAGSVSDQVYDHTSIIKTILARFRNQISAEDLARFGPRVNMIAHLANVLDQGKARTGLGNLFRKEPPMSTVPIGIKKPPKKPIVGVPITKKRFVKNAQQKKINQITQLQRSVKQLEREINHDIVLDSTVIPNVARDTRDFRESLRQAFKPHRD